ncbi:uncharacterized protein N7506_004131 [Penicillium brevicompactum]|uniref:uncharacterized protein n=1 Tax=Penicillium brevicompactum TaxID=5074 RepID=UPI00254137CB|nr:uncharacterized protein N7506_004131 [Penicillium brevicompactum]KAJ5336109.1 hypothetical protein N7506_004131 [Penicillium brevicompactum]
MHFNAEEGSPNLKFDIAAPRGWSYALGDTIIGNVVRHSPIVASEAELTVTLSGRVKTKVCRYENSSGPPGSSGSKTTYRSEFQLLDLAPEVVYQGPLHLPEGSDETLNWPFQVTIPTQPAERIRNSLQHPQPFLSGSFYSNPDQDGSQCKVEYSLTAILRYKFGRDREHKAIWPINIRHIVPECQDRYAVRAWRSQKSLRSQRLLPGMDNASLSLKQGFKKFLHTSSVPKLFYDAEITIPCVIQLDDPQPLPVSLQIVPCRDQTTEIIKDTPQEFKINWINLLIHRHTEHNAQKHHPERLHDKPVEHSETMMLDTGLQRLSHNMDSPLTISTGKLNEPVHLGNTFQLTFSPKGLSSGTKPLTPLAKIYPEFNTYRISHKNSFEWQVCVSVAGETRLHKIMTEIRVIDAV